MNTKEVTFIVKFAQPQDPEVDCNHLNDVYLALDSLIRVGVIEDYNCSEMTPCTERKVAYKVGNKEFGSFNEVKWWAWNEYKIDLLSKVDYSDVDCLNAACIELNTLINSLEETSE